MSNDVMLKRLEIAKDYLERMQAEGCSIIDLNMVENFSRDNKKDLPSTLVFERNERWHAVRSDWTKSLLNYNDSYFLEDSNFCYFGPVIRDYRSFYQAGVELYHAPEAQRVRSLKVHLDFVRDKAAEQGKRIRTLVVNNVHLIDMYMKKYGLTPEIPQLIYEKNISALRDALGEDHALCRILSTRVSKQYELLEETFGADNPELVKLRDIRTMAEEENIKCIVDLSFRSPQEYYDGIYFQAFMHFNTPVLSGGEYGDEAFGIALNIENGGLL